MRKLLGTTIITCMFFSLLVSCIPSFNLSSTTPTLDNLAVAYKASAWTFELEGKNDGKLSLTISDAHIGCHPLNQPIQIQMTFHNLTNDNLVIPDIFQATTNTVGVATDLIATIKPADQDQIYALPESPIGSALNSLGRASAYHKLPANSTFETIVDYRIYLTNRDHLSIAVYDDEKGKEYFFPIGPGQYFLKFLYTLWQFNSTNGRNEKIASATSNRIEICLK